MEPLKRRILCVDESHDTCHTLSSLLGERGYETATADSPLTALLMVEGGKFDLYIVDPTFKNGAGRELCRRIRETDVLAPVIIYTGETFEGEMQAAFAAEVDAFIRKPEIKPLVGAVERLLSEGRG